MTTAAATAAYQIWQAEQRRAGKLAELAAWAIPAPALPAGYVDAAATLAGDGATDDTAALQALANALPAGATLFFPAATYRIDSRVNFTKPIALVGETGTVIDCSHATAAAAVLALDPTGGSPTNRIAGYSLTGLTIQGPGIETDPVMAGAYHTDGLHVSHTKFQDIGRTGLRLYGCGDTLVDRCVFDTIYKTGGGYGVCVTGECDDTVVRQNWFTTLCWHGVSTIVYEADYENPAAWPRALTVEDNYFEGCADTAAIDAHQWMAGPYTIARNVVSGCHWGVFLRGAENGALVDDNDFLDCTRGIWVDLINYSTEVPPAMVLTFSHNRIETSRDWAIWLGSPANVAIDGNVIVAPPDAGVPVIDTEGYGSLEGFGEYVPTTYEITNNIYSNGGIGDHLASDLSVATLVSGNVYLPIDPLAGGPATFAISPAVAVTGEAVAFADMTEGTPPDWEWDFGDGSGSAAQHPTHAYPTAGVYPVALAADTTTAVQTVTVVPGVSYGGARLSEADLGPLDHDPTCNATDLQNGRVGLQGSPVSRRTWTINALADDHAEIDALALLKGRHAVLNINGTEYPGVMIRPPMFETQLTPAAWAYQIGLVQETRR